MKKLNLILVGALVCMTPLLEGNCLAQTETEETPSDEEKKKYVVQLTNGVERVGYVLEDNGREILLETEKLGKIYIAKADIESMRLLEDEDMIEIDGEKELIGPFTTRYHFSTNALPLRKKDNYALINLYGPEVHFAVSNHLSLGVMTTWIASPVVFVGKYTFETSNPLLNFGVGTMIGTSGYIRNFGVNGGMHWGTVTYGNRLSNVSLSLGYGYIHNPNKVFTLEEPGTYESNSSGFEPFVPQDINEYPWLNLPLINVAGVTQLGKKASLIVDVIYMHGKRPGAARDVVRSDFATVSGFEYAQTITVTETDRLIRALVVMPGVRFQKTPNKAFQFSLAGVTVFQPEQSSFPLPSASWFYRF